MDKELRLIAHDAEDLEVMSAHLQDAVSRVGDLAYLAKEKRFAAMFNRFQWEEGAGKRAKTGLRARTGIHFDLVTKVTHKNIAKDRPEGVLNLLAIRFEETDAPSGTICLIFSGGAEIRLEVEAVEAHMRDIGLYREAAHTPHHDLD